MTDTLEFSEPSLGGLTSRDPLTGLHDQASLEMNLQRSLDGARGSNRRVGLCLFDIDGFMAINERHGRATGDELLRAVAARIQSTVRPSDTVARIRDDEFAVILDEIEGPERAAEVAERIRQAIHAGGHLNANVGSVSASGGVALSHGGSAHTVEELMAVAEDALVSAQWNGKDRVVVAPSRIEPCLDVPSTLDEFDEAMAQGHLDLVFQPQIYLQNDEVRGAEALIRWRPWQNGNASDTTQFIERLEQVGAIIEFDRWMLREVRRRMTHIGGQLVSVNVSPHSFSKPGFARAAVALMSDPDRVEIELTERAPIGNLSAAAENCDALRSAGVKVFIDDFGVGNSSLMRLRQLTFDGIKIDRAFVDGVPGNDDDIAMVETIAFLGRRKGVEVIAEGVETAEQAEALKALGIEVAQGFYFARPLEYSDYADYLSVHGDSHELTRDFEIPFDPDWQAS